MTIAMCTCTKPAHSLGENSREVRCKYAAPERWSIVPQTVTDPTSGLTMRFWVDKNGFSRLSILGESLPYGNRDLGFEKDGEGIAFTGTHVWQQP